MGFNKNIWMCTEQYASSPLKLKSKSLTFLRFLLCSDIPCTEDISGKPLRFMSNLPKQWLKVPSKQGSFGFQVFSMEKLTSTKSRGARSFGGATMAGLEINLKESSRYPDERHAKMS